MNLVFPHSKNSAITANTANVILKRRSMTVPFVSNSTLRSSLLVNRDLMADAAQPDLINNLQKHRVKYPKLSLPRLVTSMRPSTGETARW